MKTQDAIQEISNKLSEYMIQHQHIVPNDKGMWRCKSGLHEDKDPSCHIVPFNTAVYHCFGCSQSGSVFTLAHHIEGLPIEGSDFYKITLPTMAKKFNIVLDEEEMSDDDKEKYTRYRAYKDASTVLMSVLDKSDEQSQHTPIIYKYLAERNWSVDTAKLLKITAIDSYEKYINTMTNMGWSVEYLHSIELSSKRIFNRKNLIFIICNSGGNPVGFAARDTTYEKEFELWVKNGSKSEEKPIKYFNSLNSPIYTKGNILYNFHIAKKYYTDMWIVEGYGDVPTLYEKGIKNVVALGGVALTDEADYSHLDLLKKNNIFSLNLMFDNDEGGNIGLERAIEACSKYRYFDIKIKILPDSMDPDDFFKVKTVEDFNNIKTMNPFEYKLAKYPFHYEKERICKEMIPFIYMEKSPIIQYNMANALSARTDIPYDTINAEIKMLIGDRDFKHHEEIAEFRGKTLKEIQRCKSLESLTAKLKSISEEAIVLQEGHEVTATSSEKYKERLIEFEKLCSHEAKTGLNCGRFKRFQEVTEGFPREASFIGIAADSNCGKSSFLRALSYELLISNPDLIIILMSIDDAFSKMTSSFISLMSVSNIDDTNYLSINDVRRAKHKIWNNDAKRNKFSESWKKMHALSERLIIKDITDGSTTLALEKYVNYYKNKYHDKTVIGIIDHFHVLQDFQNEDARKRAEDTSKRLKGLTVQYNMPIISTLELRKLSAYGTRPTYLDVKETGGIVYDSDLLLLLYQDLHYDSNSIVSWETRNEFGPVRMPYLEMDFAKNKEGSFKGRAYFKFRTDSSYMEEVDRSEVVAKYETKNESKRRADPFNGGLPF